MGGDAYGYPRTPRRQNPRSLLLLAVPSSPSLLRHASYSTLLTTGVVFETGRRRRLGRIRAPASVLANPRAPGFRLSQKIARSTASWRMHPPPHPGHRSISTLILDRALDMPGTFHRSPATCGYISNRRCGDKSLSWGSCRNRGRHGIEEQTRPQIDP